MTDLIESLGKAVVPAAVGVGFALCAEIRRAFRMSIGSAIICFGRLLSSDQIDRYALVSLNNFFAASDGPRPSFRLWPQTVIWWFFPGFGALLAISSVEYYSFY
jgi:hypothetical protein